MGRWQSGLGVLRLGRLDVSFLQLQNDMLSFRGLAILDIGSGRLELQHVGLFGGYGGE